VGIGCGKRGSQRKEKERGKGPEVEEGRGRRKREKKRVRAREITEQVEKRWERESWSLSQKKQVETMLIEELKRCLILLEVARALLIKEKWKKRRNCGARLIDERKLEIQGRGEGKSSPERERKPLILEFNFFVASPR
jgi:hypothetical protein